MLSLSADLSDATVNLQMINGDEAATAGDVAHAKALMNFAEAFARDRWRTFKCEERLRMINLGGTAVGTGLTAPRSYIFLVTDKLRSYPAAHRG